MTQRRVPANPDLTWSHAAPGSEYRVAIRNEDTGHKRTLYRGQETRCRLPAEVRRSPDQWSFRVEVKPVDDPGAAFVNHQRFTAIERTGDDFITPAPDLLTGPLQAGATMYQLIIQHRGDGRRIVDILRPEPRFLLPAGQIDRPHDYQWQVSAPGLGAAGQGRWRRINAAMVDAARRRALAEVAPPAPPPVTKAPVFPAPRGWPAPVAADLGARAPVPSFLVAVELGADAALAPQPHPASVLDHQWPSVKGAKGAGPGDAVLTLVESHDLRAVVLLDVLAALALDPTRLTPTVRRIQSRGHRVELLVRPEPWFHMIPALAAAGGDLATTTAQALEAYREATGRDPVLTRFVTPRAPMETLTAARDLGLEAVMVDAMGMAGLPVWMRWRTQPFLALDGLVVVPQSRVLSTPAHAGDLTLVHGLSGDDPFLVSGLDTFVGAAAVTAAPQIVTLRSLALMAETKVRASDRADSWNREIERDHPAWVAAGLTRSAYEFQIANGANYIAADLAHRALTVLSASTLSPLDPVKALSREDVASWSLPSAYEPLVEMRRGVALARTKPVRRYDAAYRDALAAGRGAP